jgi:hypothetical protein
VATDGGVKTKIKGNNPNDKSDEVVINPSDE